MKREATSAAAVRNNHRFVHIAPTIILTLPYFDLLTLCVPVIL